MAATTTRLEEAQARYDALVVERDELRASIDGSAEEEREAVADAVRTTPSKSPFGDVNGPVQVIRRRREKAEKRLPSLQMELAALELVILEEVKREAGAKFASVTADAVAATKTELEGWKEFGQHIAALHKTWVTKIVPAAEERDQIHLDVEASGMLSGPDTEAKERFLASVQAPVAPFSIDFEEAVTRAVKVAIDAGNAGYRITDSNHGACADTQRRLPTLIPDLRATDRQAQLSGKTQKAASTNRASEGFGGSMVVR